MVVLMPDAQQVTLATDPPSPSPSGASSTAEDTMVASLGVWSRIKHLRLDGLSVGAIALETGLDRKTVRKYLHGDRPPGPVERDPPVSKLDPFKDYVRARLDQYPTLASTRLLEEIHARGFDGAYSIVQRFVCGIRAAKEVVAVVRFETVPGRQAQVDWAYAGSIEADGRRVKVYAFCYILGYSRA